MPETEIHIEPVRRDGSRHPEHQDDESWMERHHVHSDRDILVPLVDEQEAGRIYDPSLLHWALWGALLGALLLGWLGAAMANGDLPIAGLGQWAAAGPLLASVTGGGLGIAVGGLIGALLALYRMPPRHPKQHEDETVPEHRTTLNRGERVVVEPEPYPQTISGSTLRGVGLTTLIVPVVVELSHSALNTLQRRSVGTRAGESGEPAPGDSAVLQAGADRRCAAASGAIGCGVPSAFAVRGRRRAGRPRGGWAYAPKRLSTPGLSGSRRVCGFDRVEII